MQKSKKYLLFVLVIVLGVGLDQYTKHLANIYLGPSCNPEYPGFDASIQSECPYRSDALFTWHHVYNDGAFLSLGADWSPGMRLFLLTVLPGILLLGVLVYFLRSDKVRFIEALTFALIAAGGVGNIVDRVMAGKVVDFMYMDLDLFNAGWEWARTGIFNVADLYIVIGVVLYAIMAIKAFAANPRAFFKGSEEK